MDSSRATPDCTLENRHHRALSASRRSPRDSHRGSHYQAMADMAFPTPDALGLSPLPPHMPTPVMAPQPAPACYGNSLGQQDDRARSQMRILDRNPFYEHSQFRQYRTRQEQKEEKDGQKWPPILEDPFLDALLLIPDMGRSKFFMHQALHGRNMIISMYVWMAYCMALPPGKAPDPANRRDRKAISSHIQVLKNFFKDHRFFHFFFPTKDEEQRRGCKEENKTVESLSLKTNPVLVALAAGHFPDVRPNYDYFAHLLALDSAVAAKPKTCWVFVSSPHVTLDEDRTLKSLNGETLDAATLPQLARAVNEDGKLPRGPDGSVILHEYTNGAEQSYSGAAKDVTKHWETAFRSLHETLNLPEPQDEDSLTILEMTVSLELHRSAFPAGSELNGVVELSIAQPGLQNCQWKCVTRLARPPELCADSNADETFLEHTDEVGVQFVHQAGCGDGRTGCDCMTRPRQDIRVPFPAVEWASMLTNCASYPEGSPQETGRRSSRNTATGSEGEDDETGSQYQQQHQENQQEPTQVELISRIGMFQELWSSPPASSLSSSSATWTRRAVIFWRFRDVHRYNSKKKRWVAEPPSAQWRFLTVNDPTSEYHMRNAYLSPVAAAAKPLFNTGCLSPEVFSQERRLSQHSLQHAHPSPHQQLGGTQQPQQQHFAPSADFLAWNMNASVSNHFTSIAGTTAGLPVMALPDGLVAPIPVSLADSFVSSFETSHASSSSLGGQQHLGYFAPSCGGTSAESQDGSMLDDLPGHLSAEDPFLQDGLSAAGSVGLMYEDVKCDPALQAWGTGLDGWPADATATTAAEFDPALTSSDGTTPEWKVEGSGAGGVWSTAASKDVSWAPAVQMGMHGGGDTGHDGVLHDIDSSGLTGPRGMKRSRQTDLEINGGHDLGDMERMERPARRIKREPRRVAGQA